MKNCICWIRYLFKSFSEWVFCSCSFYLGSSMHALEYSPELCKCQLFALQGLYIMYLTQQSE